MSSSEDDMLHRCNMRTCLMRVSRKECNMNVPSHPRVEWSWLEIGSENWIHRKSVFWVFRWQSIWVRFSAITQVPELFGEMTNYKTKRPKSTVRKTSCNLSCSLSFLQNILGHFVISPKYSWSFLQNNLGYRRESHSNRLTSEDTEYKTTQVNCAENVLQFVLQFVISPKYSGTWVIAENLIQIDKSTDIWRYRIQNDPSQLCGKRMLCFS